MANYSEKTGRAVALNHQTDNKLAQGWLNGFIGMLIFSGSLPATQVTVLKFSPLFLTEMRAVNAALLAMSVLVCIFGAKRFSR